MFERKREGDRGESVCVREREREIERLFSVQRSLPFLSALDKLLCYIIALPRPSIYTCAI